MKQQGFNLISLLATMTLLAIIVAFVLVKIDPVSKIKQAKDDNRQQDILLIAYALKDYMLDHQGDLPNNISLSLNKKVLCSSSTAPTLTCGDDSESCLYIPSSDDFLVHYLEDLPVAPDKASTTDSGYYVKVDDNFNLVVGACNVDGDEEIAYTTNSRVQVETWTCEGAGGYQYGDHCWFLGDDQNKNCNTVCANHSVICETGVTPSDFDASCTVFKNLETDPLACTVSCSRYASGSYSYMPSFYDHATLTTYYPKYCYVDLAGVIDCAGASHSSYRYVCPCVQS